MSYQNSENSSTHTYITFDDKTKTYIEHPAPAWAPFINLNPMDK